MSARAGDYVESLFSYWFAGNSAKVPASSSSSSSTNKTFAVIQTNWYFRQQLRVLRLGAEGIVRLFYLAMQIHPITVLI